MCYSKKGLSGLWIYFSSGVLVMQLSHPQTLLFQCLLFWFSHRFLKCKVWTWCSAHMIFSKIITHSYILFLRCVETLSSKYVRLRCFLFLSCYKTFMLFKSLDFVLYLKNLFLPIFIHLKTFTKHLLCGKPESEHNLPPIPMKVSIH